jgi:predicted anti-sigma-YlaC factor YlaD
MDCIRMRGFVLEGGDLTSPEATRHLEECPACRTLFAKGPALARALGDTQMARPAEPLPSFAALARQLEDEGRRRGRLPDLPSGQRWALALAALALPIFVGLVRHRHNLAAYPSVRLVLELGALAGLAFASCWLWLRPVYKRQPGHLMLWAALALALALPWVLSGLPAALPANAHPVLARVASEWRRAANCFAYGSLTALPALLVVTGLGRRRAGFPGFAILPATAAALAGLLGLQLHCPEASPTHLLLGHAPIAWALPLLLILARVRRRGDRPVRQP